MNKKITIPVVPIVLIIVLVIGIISLVRVKQDTTSKLSKIYNKMIENQTYSFTRYDFEEKNKSITYKKNNKTLIDMKEYYLYPSNSSDEEILTETLKNIIDLEYTEEKEKIYGVTYKYEEYKGISDFLISSSNYMDANSVKTRFYFKGNNLEYIKTIYNVVNEETGEVTQVEELQTVKVEYKVEDSIFTIPRDYAEN